MRANYETLVSLDGDLSKPELILWIEQGREPFGSCEESRKLENVKYSSAEAHFDPVTEQQRLGDSLQGHGSSGLFLGQREDISFGPKQGLSLVTPPGPDTLAAAAHCPPESAPEGGIPSHSAPSLPSWQSLPRPHLAWGESFGKKNHLGTHPVGHSKDPPSGTRRKPASRAEVPRLWELAGALRPAPCPACGRSPQGKRYFLRSLGGLARKGPSQRPKCKVCSHPEQALSGPAPSQDALSTATPKDSPPCAKGPASWRGIGGAPSGGASGRPGQPPEDAKPFHCTRCSARFRLQSQLRAHQRWHTDRWRFPCSECSLAFPKRCQLQEHLRLHTGERPFQCPACPKRFCRKALLREHQHTHSARKPFPCGQCDKSFTRRGALTDHLRLHSGERPFPCPHCEQRFRLKGQLHSHLRRHTSERPFQCPDCGKRYWVWADMKTHQLRHGGELPFSCKCGKGFTKRIKLLQHIRTHTGEKSYQCPKCGKTLRAKWQLRSHQRVVHSGERPFHCPECDKSYREKCHLLRHQLTHRPDKPFVCGDCGKGFVSKYNLAKHVRVHTKSRLPKPEPEPEPDPEIKRRLSRLLAMIEADWS